MALAFQEQRKSERFAVKKPATIIVPPGISIESVVTDISDGGARILIRDTELPEVFMLQFSESGQHRHCRVVWRRNSEIGVAFTDRKPVHFGRRMARP